MLAYMAELLLRTPLWGSKTISKIFIGPRGIKTGQIEQWNKVLSTDKSKFKIFQSNGRVYMQWRVDEKAATPHIMPSVKNGGGSVLVWEAFANCKVGDLHQLKGKLNQTGYHSTLQHHAIPSEIWLVGQGFILLPDYDPKHTSKLCQWLIKSKKIQHVLQLMSCLVKSADLNPIELVWNELNQLVRAKQATSAAHFWQLWQESWEELSSIYLQSLVERIPRICVAVIVAKRGSF